MNPITPGQSIFKNMTVQVLVAMRAGVLVGRVCPEVATALKPLGDAFIRLVKMVVGRHGICSFGSLAQMGRLGLKALI